MKAGHVVPEISLERVKHQLSQVSADTLLPLTFIDADSSAQVRGSLVEMPLQFLIEEKELVEARRWLFCFKPIYSS